MCGGLREKVGLASCKEEMMTCINSFFVKCVVAATLFPLQTIVWSGWHSYCKQGKDVKCMKYNERRGKHEDATIYFIFFVLLFFVMYFLFYYFW